MKLRNQAQAGGPPRKTAIRFTRASASWLTRSASLPAQYAVTMCCFYNIRSAFSGGDFIPISVGLVNNKIMGVGYDPVANGFGGFSYDGTTRNVVFARQPVIGEANFVAFTCKGSGAADHVAYHARPGGTAFESVTQQPPSAFTPDGLTVGTTVYDTTDYWDGCIWDVGVWNRVLSASEVLLVSKYGPLAIPYGLVGFYPLNDKTDFKDRGNLRLDLTTAGAGTYTTEQVQLFPGNSIPSPAQVAVPFAVVTASAPAEHTTAGAWGQFTPTRYTLDRALRQATAQDTSNITGQTHAPSAVFGRFTPPRHTLNRQLRQNEPQDTSNITGQTHTAAGVPRGFAPPRHVLFRQLREAAALDVPATAQPETNVHTRGAFQAPWSRLNRRLLQADPQDTSNITGQIPSDLSWEPTFRAPWHQLLRLLRENPALEIPVGALQIATATVGVVRFTSPWSRLNRQLLSNEAQDLSNPVDMPGGDSGFLSPYTPSQIGVLLDLIQNPAQDAASAPPQESTAASWTGKFTAPGSHLTRQLWQNEPQDASNVVQPSTDLSWCGRFYAPFSRLTRQMWQNEAQDASNIVGQVPSDLSWAPSFKAPWAWATRALRENPAGDVPIVAEVPVDLSAVVGSFKAPRATLLQQLWHNEAQDSSTLTPQTPVDFSAVVGSFKAPMPWLNRALWQNPAVDYANPPPVDRGAHSGPNRLALIALYTEAFKRSRERREAEREAELQARREAREAPRTVKRAVRQATLQPRAQRAALAPLPLLPEVPTPAAMALPTVAEIVAQMTEGLPSAGELRQLGAELKELQRKQRRRKTEEEVILHLIQSGAL